jgi:ribosomal protein S19
MARSQWKGLGLEKSYLDNGKNIWCRSRRIIMNDVGQIYKVYNGRKFVEVLVNELMVGRIFGEYVMTRTMDVGIHNKKSKKKGK